MSMENTNYIETIEGECITRVYTNDTKDGGFSFSAGTKATWKKKGQWGYCLHSFNDQPAIDAPITQFKEWFKDGRQHRDNGPSQIYGNGCMVWLKEGRHLHDDGVSCPVFYPKDFKHENPEKDCHALNPNKLKFGAVDYMPPCCRSAFPTEWRRWNDDGTPKK